uniref:Transporter n=1 Tax=Hirondellea gigas TaxID=1518452 RepID=A0A6A7FVW4_9CRUS
METSCMMDREPFLGATPPDNDDLPPMTDDDTYFLSALRSKTTRSASIDYGRIMIPKVNVCNDDPPIIKVSSVEDHSILSMEVKNRLTCNYDNSLHSINNRSTRSFSVVPVDDIKSSPNANLVHMKRKLSTLSKEISDIETDETESLLSSNYNSINQLNQKTLSLRSISGLDTYQCATPEKETIKTIKSVKPLEDNNLTTQSKTSPADRKTELDFVKTPEALMAPWCQQFSPSTKPEKSQLNKFKKIFTSEKNLRRELYRRKEDSAAATLFPRVELNEQDIPQHYLTINSCPMSPYSEHSPTQYLTIQPTRSRVISNHSVLDIRKSAFLNQLPSGYNLIDFGTTDGRNIIFSGRAIMPSDSITMSSSVATTLNQQTITSQGSVSSRVPALVVLSNRAPLEGEAQQCTNTQLLTQGNTNNITAGSPAAGEGDEKQHGFPVPIPTSPPPARASDGLYAEMKSKGQQAEDRGTWDNKLKFVLACIGSCVGLGNFWRFPYLCYKSGGGAFLLPYSMMLFLCGVPLLLMEMAIGQFTGQGPIGAILKLCPIFIGSAVGVVIISIIFCSYYNVIIAWSIYYLMQSFRSPLPWAACADGNTTATAQLAGPYCNVTIDTSPTQYFFDSQVLHKSDGIEYFGGLVLPLLGCVVVAWVIVYFSIWRSVKSSGNVVLVTATVPYVFIMIFLVRAVTLDGAGDGLKYLFSPNWKLLLDVKVWVNAAAQNFNSIGIGFGSMITFSSYNKFSNNLLMDVWLIAMVNAGTSLLAGIIVFSTMGNIGYELGKNITEVVAEGPGLVFVVYPQALARMPFPNMFAFLFFLLLIILGIDSQFATVEVIVTSLKDAFPNWTKKYLKRHEVLALLVCLFCFTLGLPNIFEGGIYYFTLLDYYSASISLMYLAFFEVVAVVWCYGATRLSRNIKEMTGKLPSLYFKYCWMYVSPLLIMVIAMASWLDYEEPTYNNGEYEFPPWAIALGWLVACVSIVPIPVGVVIMTFLAPGATIWQKFLNAAQPRIKDCPKCKRSIQEHNNQCQCLAVSPNGYHVPMTLVHSISFSDQNCTSETPNYFIYPHNNVHENALSKQV